MKKLRFTPGGAKRYHLAIDAANTDARVYFDKENPEAEVSDEMAAGLLKDYPANFKEVVTVSAPKKEKEVDPAGDGGAGPKKTK